MKNTKNGFIGIAVTILFALLLVGGGIYFVAKQQDKTATQYAISTVASQQFENTTSNSDFKTYTNSQFGVRFMYPEDKVTISNNNVFSKNSRRYVNFSINTGGNFSFDILQDSDKMTPSFTTELDEVKFKSSISAGWNDITKFSELNINGQTAYRMQVYAKGDNDPNECAYEKIVTKKDGYWYEFYAKICGGDTDESLKTFESVATSLEFTK